MDQALRDLERRCALAPQDAGPWTALARGRLRSGARPASALEAVRGGLRAGPADDAVLSVRDDVLAAFWREPRFRVLHARDGPGGRVLAFSADGSLLGVAGDGVVVYRVDANEIAGAALAGADVTDVAFCGRDLVVACRGEVARIDPDDGTRLASWREPAFALAVSPDGERVLVVVPGRAVWLDARRRRVLRVVGEAPVAASRGQVIPFAGRRPEEDALLLAGEVPGGARVLVGPRLEALPPEGERSGTRGLAPRLAGVSPALARRQVERTAALTPDGRGLLLTRGAPGERGPGLAPTEPGVGPDAQGLAGAEAVRGGGAVACSPDGSRFAVACEGAAPGIAVIEAC